MIDPTRSIGDGLKKLITKFAAVLNKIFKGRLKANHITTLSLLGHLPAAWALIDGRPLLASLLILIFGLMDSLDGALARSQNAASKFGMFFDAITDRVKETLLYIGLSVYLQQVYPEQNLVWLAPALVGSSLLVSYVKAKGEMAITQQTADKQKLNRIFGQGLGRYEIRMFLLIVGLILNTKLLIFLGILLTINVLTAIYRFWAVSKHLQQKPQSKSKK